MVGSTAWSDLNKDGKRLERIIKDMDTKQKNAIDNDLKFAYIDRLIKATHLKVNIAETVLNVKGVLQQAKKQGIEKPLEVPIINA